MLFVKWRGEPQGKEEQRLYKLSSTALDLTPDGDFFHVGESGLPFVL